MGLMALHLAGRRSNRWSHTRLHDIPSGFHVITFTFFQHILLYYQLSNNEAIMNAAVLGCLGADTIYYTITWRQAQ